MLTFTYLDIQLWFLLSYCNHASPHLTGSASGRWLPNIFRGKRECSCLFIWAPGGEDRHATSTSKKKKSEVAHFWNALFSSAAETEGDTATAWAYGNSPTINETLFCWSFYFTQFRGLLPQPQQPTLSHLYKQKLLVPLQHGFQEGFVGWGYMQETLFNLDYKGFCFQTLQ